jgi:hypothetical protein
MMNGKSQFHYIQGRPMHSHRHHFTPRFCSGLQPTFHFAIPEISTFRLYEDDDEKEDSAVVVAFPCFWDLFQSGRFFLPFVGKAIRDYHIKSEVRNSATFPLILQCSSLCAKVTTLQVQSWCWNLEWWVLQSKNV